MGNGVGNSGLVMREVGTVAKSAPAPDIYELITTDIATLVFEYFKRVGGEG